MKWELLKASPGSAYHEDTVRTPVEGGWLYMHSRGGGPMTYVPRSEIEPLGLTEDDARRLLDLAEAGVEFTTNGHRGPLAVEDWAALEALRALCGVLE
jgi:hypothetical protein